MPQNDHFEIAADWEAAERLVDFKPRRPSYTAGCTLNTLAIYVKDPNKRPLPIGKRSLEAHYGRFVIDQHRTSSEEEAKRRTFAGSYGQDPVTVRIAGHPGCSYAPGPEPEPGDIGGRAPAVIVWHDGDMFYLIASEELDNDVLRRIGSSMYGQNRDRRTAWRR